MDSLQPKPTAPGELEAIVTGKIKRSLYKASKRGASSKDLDTDFDPAKTPRPAPRKGSGRYPVKASRDDIDQAVTSPPDAPPVPSIPSKHQMRSDLSVRGVSRSQRGLNASTDAPILWSPNSSFERQTPSDYSNQLTGSTLRSDHRSHAIITPRLPPSSAKLSDSSTLMTSPDSSDGSGMTAILMGQGGNVVTQFQPNLSRSIDSARIISLWTKAIVHGSRALLAFIKILEYIRGSVVNGEWGEAQLTRVDSLLRSLRNALRSLEDRRLLLPITQTPRQMNLIGRSISSTLLQVFDLTGVSRALLQDTLSKVVTDDVITKLLTVSIALGDNTDLASCIATAQYQLISARVVMMKARALLPSEFFQKLEASQASVVARRHYAPSMGAISTNASSLGNPSVNTAVSLAVRPVQSATQSPVGLSASSSVVDFPSSMSFASSPTASEPPFSSWSNRMVDPEDARRTEVQDLQYTRLLSLLNRVIQACLSPEYSALKFLTECIQDKDQQVQANPGAPGNTPMALRMWHETAESLTKTLAMVEKVVEYLPLAPTAKEFNEMQQLQEYIRFMISFWGDFCATVSSIRRAGLWKGMPGMIPKYMQMIHVPIKEFSKYLKASPQWMHLAMDTSVLPGREQVIAAPNGGEIAPETPSESFPPTPLGAALGPAAAAAMARPNAAFMSRYDQYASATNRRY
ncbi:hypothetical protein, variant [Verruconis gallopava]|nr:hypothetical protein, variant [Verruconis gallopava]KIW05135.1 hypothetical protein, variant [Verruconis gallopava]